MPPMAGRHLEFFLFRRLAGVVARPKIFILMAVLGSRPTSMKVKVIVSTPDP